MTFWDNLEVNPEEIGQKNIRLYVSLFFQGSFDRINNLSIMLHTMVNVVLFV